MIKKGSIHDTIVRETILTTEKVTTSDDMQKCTENIKTSQEVVEGTYEVHKHTDEIRTSDEGVKVTDEDNKHNQKITTN